MKTERIHIKNYKVFRDMQVKNMGKMNVFLGANGSGKTTFFDVFSFLSDALYDNVTVAINRRGGFPEVISRGCNVHNDLISVELRFRYPQSGADSSPLVTYHIEIGWKAGRAFVNREILKYRRDRREKTWHLLDFRCGEGTVIINEEEYGKTGAKEERDSQKLAEPDILAVKGLGQFERFKVIRSLRTLLEKWHVSDFRIENGRNISNTAFASHLSVTGDNLAQVTKYMYEEHPEIFAEILEKLPSRIPGIHKVEARETEDGRVILRFQDRHFKDPFISRHISDGTIKMFAYMILLHDPDPHPLLCIEEPENFIYPDLLPELCEEIRQYAGQVFVSTHSPDFVNGLSVEELYFLDKKEGYTQIKAAGEEELVRELSKENQLGWLWRNHYIRGASLR